MKHILLISTFALTLAAGMAQAQDMACKSTQGGSSALCEGISQKADTRTQLRLMAQSVKQNRHTSGATGFAASDRRVGVQYCCSCVPGKDCSAGKITDVCSPLPSGAETCPGGEFRTNCTGDFCTTID
jgi:hypothetical protein